MASAHVGARVHVLDGVGRAVLVLCIAGCAAESEVAGTAEKPSPDAGAPDPLIPGTDPPGDEPQPAASCGNLSCEAGEDCESCPRDCGECPRCDLAPSCTGAVAVPTMTSHLEACDNQAQPIYVCGVGLGVPPSETSCLDPQLRMRIRQIRMVRGATSNNIYCVIDADDGFHSEALVSPLQTATSSDTVIYAPAAGTFWGQTDLYRSISNLTVTYQCFENTDTQRYREVFDRIEESAREAGGAAGPYGWAFGLGSVAAGIVSAAIGGGGDTLRLSVQQTIDAGALLELTNGRTWEIQHIDEGGVFGIGAYAWILEVESWGCADVRSDPR